MKKNSYDVMVRVEVETNISIRASSYEEALEQARQLGVKDVVEFDTDFNDGNIRVTGIFINDELPHK